MAKIQTKENYTDLSFPLAGIDRSLGFARQPKRPFVDGYTRTTPTGQNVRAFEPVTNRARGGQRSGLKRYLDAQLSSSNLIQEVNQVVGVGYSNPGGGVQTSQSSRVVTLVAVSQGTIKVADAGASSWTAVTNGTAALNTSGVILSAANNQKLYFVDGTNWKYYQPSDNTVYSWSASAGSLPVDSAGNAPRLICTWRGRTVLSGLLKDGQNWFMSAVNDPTNFDYAPSSPSPTQAVAGNNSSLGLIGDVITGLVPFSDDVLVIGGDHTLWMINGDPMAGGQIDRISDSIGMAWGQAWCKDPYGAIYFVSNLMGIYKLVVGQAPQRVSQPIEQLLQAVNTGTYTIRLAWDDRFQGLHVFVTKTSGAAAATHYFFEARTGAWWTDVFGNNDHNPLCCTTFDGNLPTDRVVLIGSWDGYVRYFDKDALKDDGTAISSEVWIGPLTSKDMDDILLKDLQAVLGTSSGDITFSVYVGETAEAAFASEAVVTGTWVAGRNYSSLVRRAGHAIYVKLTATAPWQIEQVRASIAGTGKTRRRGR